MAKNTKQAPKNPKKGAKVEVEETTVLTNDNDVNTPVNENISPVDQNIPPVDNTEDELNLNVWKNTGPGKVKIKLLCDVYHNNEKLKAGESIELEKEELARFSDSFYEKL